MVINIQDDILKLHATGLLDLLLKDKATKGNILWATDAYAEQGEFYAQANEIRSQRITGENSDLIKTRARRAMEQRTARTRQHAEVFTPLWVVKKMNDFADEQWFGRKRGFWKYTRDGRIYFSKEKHWKRYVDAKRLEITCGEAPFLVTRYDVETGEAIPVEERIGLLDRKLRAVSENTADLEEWKTWALRAVQATYGYELQGDNLLIARVNILLSVEEHLFARWKQKPDRSWQEKLCNVICWNIWQMDGIRGCVPVEPKPTEEQLSLFPPEMTQMNLFGELEVHEIPCRLFNWRGDRSISYNALREKGTKIMKFDFIIGNPPYQEETDNNNRQNPIYHLFMEEAFKIGNITEFITPARFLFNAGQTPKSWNKKMLSDPHFKILSYESDAAKVFQNVEIKGGLAISIRNDKMSYGEIGVFTEHNELNSILHKVQTSQFESISKISVGAVPYHFSECVREEHPELIEIIGSSFDLRTNILDKLDGKLFFDIPPSNNSIRIYGLRNKHRAYLYIEEKYVKTPANNGSYKIMLPKASGAGKFGEALSAIEIGEPKVGHTQSFISIGNFQKRIEAENAKKYAETKFMRALLSVLKTTQDITPQKFAYVPLQDFTPSSDIDWSKSIPEIDQQLYAKYGLDEAEIAFIETHVKEMS